MSKNDAYIDAILVCGYDYERRSWGNIPDDLWSALVSNVSQFGVTGLGLQDVLDTSSLQSFPPFSDLSPTQQGKRRYFPYHLESSSEIMSFAFDDAIKKAVLSEDFDQWNRGNDDLPVDEIIFFSHDIAKIHAIHYENIIKLNHFSHEELQVLRRIHPAIESSMYTNCHQMLCLSKLI
jgi:hypothetical protein